MRRRLLLIVPLLAVLAHQSNGFSGGAPDTTCSSMMPKHDPVGPQNGPSPFAVSPNKLTAGPGEEISLRLFSDVPTENFKGFLIKAVNPANESSGAVGSFINPPANTKFLTCSPGFQNALTHGTPEPKTSLDLLWKAPSDYEGDVLFRCTFVKSSDKFWAQVPATSLVRVDRSAPAAGSSTPAYQAPTTYNRDQTSFAYVPLNTTTARTVSTSPVVNTPAWSFASPTAKPTASAQLPSVYTGCGDIKGCFGMIDSGCVQEGNCLALVTYALKGQRYEFELWAPNSLPNSYVAVGFSDDRLMGDDSVSECALVNGRVNAYMSFNEGKKNIRLREASSGLKVIEAKYSDGNLYCRFERQTLFSIGEKSFDMAKSHYLLLARGSATENGVGYHERQKTVSARAVSLAETGAVGASKGTLMKLHGALMVAAWMFAASCGILVARYFRLTWVGKQFMGKDLWFVFHRMLMVITWALTMVGVVLIFVELGGWTSLPVTTNPHPVIGIVTTVLAFIQPIMAYFRPHPGTPKRFIFNWAHWLVGNSAHILGIVCIFLAVDLDKAAIPYWVNWLLVTYVAIHAVSHIVLSLAQCCYHSDGSRKPSAVFAMRDLAPHQSNQSHFYSTQQDKKEDAHGSKFRKILLFLYIVLVASFSAAVIGTIVTGPWVK